MSPRQNAGPAENPDREREVSREEAETARQRAKTNALVERHGFLGLNPELDPGGTERRRQVGEIVENMHTGWQERVVNSWDAAQVQLEQQAADVRAALGVAEFNPQLTKDLNRMIDAFTKDPRRRNGSLPFVYSLINPLQNDLLYVEKLRTSPAHSGNPTKRAALEKIFALAQTRFNALQVPPEAQAYMEKRHRELTTVDGMDRFKKASIMLVGGVATVMTLITGGMAFFGKRSMKPAAFYALAAFLAFGGTKMLTTRPGEMEIEQLSFLGEDLFLTLQREYGIGKGWENPAKIIVENPPEVLKKFLENMRKNRPITAEDEEAVLAALGAPENVQPQLQRMIRNHADFSRFITLIRQAGNKDTRSALYAYLQEDAGPAHVQALTAEALNETEEGTQ